VPKKTNKKQLKTLEQIQRAKMLFLKKVNSIGSKRAKYWTIVKAAFCPWRDI